MVSGNPCHRAVHRCRFLLVALLAGGLATPARAGDALDPGTSHPGGAEAGEEDSRTAYVVGAGDVLNLFVWKEPELTRDLTVRIDGQISVPLLGDVLAAGKSTEALGSELREALKRYIAAPNVTVSVSENANTRFYIVGRVAKPGEYPLLTGNTTFLQALAIAGGFVEFAKTDHIMVVRHAEGSGGPVFLNYKKLSQGEGLEQNIVLLPGDTIVVP
jgi:polysaccharide export outer membrane protein